MSRRHRRLPLWIDLGPWLWLGLDFPEPPTFEPEPPPPNLLVLTVGVLIDSGNGVVPG